MVARVRLNDPPSIEARLRRAGTPEPAIALHLDRLRRARAQRRKKQPRYATPRQAVAEALAALNDLRPSDLDCIEATALRALGEAARRWGELASARMPPVAQPS
jgi:hypothetical protein